MKPPKASQPDPWRNCYGEPIEPSEAAAHWCALWFHACDVAARNPYADENPHLRDAAEAAAAFVELDRKRAHPFRSPYWVPPRFWPPLEEE